MRANLYEVSKWPSQKFQPVAWDGHDTAHPNERTTDGEGNAEYRERPRLIGAGPNRDLWNVMRLHGEDQGKEAPAVQL